MEECIFDLGKVHEGQVVKNYKELCILLGVKPKTGKSKMYQMREIERYLFLKSAGGNKILIKGVYEEPLDKVDLRKEGNNSVYKELISPGMICILRKAKSKRFICSKGYLLQELGFVNSNYRTCRNNIPETSKYLNVPEENLRDFFAITQTRVMKALRDNFELFRKNSYCMVVDIHIICLKNDNEELIYRPTTEEEDYLILKCENIAKKELKIQNDAEIHYKDMWGIYSTRVKEELRKHNPNICYYYDGYYFKMDRDSIEDAYYTLVKSVGLTLREIRNKINAESTKSAHDSVAKRQKLAQGRADEREEAKAKGDYTFLAKKHAIARDEMIMSKDFEKHGKKMANNLISIKANSAKVNRDNKNDEELSLYPENEDFMEGRIS